MPTPTFISYETGQALIVTLLARVNTALQIKLFIPLHDKFLQFDWLRAVVFQLNLRYLHLKITNPLRVVV